MPIDNWNAYLGMPGGLALGMAMRFEVTIDGLGLGAWSKCDGLGVDFVYLKYREGGTNSHQPLLPDYLSYSEITLMRALSKQDSTKVMSWLAQKAQSFSPGTGVIKLFDANTKEVMSWTLRNVVPKKWTGPRLLADITAGVATETLVLVHEGFLGE
jgi:phage tail-like protein